MANRQNHEAKSASILQQTRIRHMSFAAESTDKDLLLVTSDLQESLGHHLGEYHPELLAILTFSQALDMLRRNRKTEPINSPTKWHPFSKGAWHKDGILPRNILVVFHIDPTVPTDCALGLMFLAEWALDVSSEPEANVQILTLSTDDNCDFLHTYFDIDSLMGRAVIHGSVSDLDTEDKVTTAFLEDPSVPQIVVSFRPPQLATHLDQRVKAEDFCHRFLESEQDAREITDIIERQESNTFVWLTINPALPVIPLHFSGYQKVRVVLGLLNEPSPCWDNKTHQIASYSRRVDRET